MTIASLDAELERANAAHDAWAPKSGDTHAGDAVNKIRLQMLVRQTVALERIAAALEPVSRPAQSPTLYGALGGLSVLVDVEQQDAVRRLAQAGAKQLL